MDLPTLATVADPARCVKCEAVAPELAQRVRGMVAVATRSARSCPIRPPKPRNRQHATRWDWTGIEFSVRDPFDPDGGRDRGACG
jgi:hypothetical protein